MILPALNLNVVDTLAVYKTVLKLDRYGLARERLYPFAPSVTRVIPIEASDNWSFLPTISPYNPQRKATFANDREILEANADRRMRTKANEKPRDISQVGVNSSVDLKAVRL